MNHNSTLDGIPFPDSGCSDTALIGNALIALPAIAIAANPPDRPFRIGFLNGQSPNRNEQQTAAFINELTKLGYSDGVDIKLDIRGADGELDRLPQLVTDILTLKPDVILTGGTPPTLLFKKTGTLLPVVFVNVGADPVKLGLVQSLSRPGGNFTGITNNTAELGGKRLQLLNELVPDVRRVAAFYNPSNAAMSQYLEDVKSAGLKLNLKVIPIETNRVEDLPTAFRRAKEKDVQAVLNSADPIAGTVRYRKSIIELAQQAALPTMYNFRLEVVEGGLASYGADVTEPYRRGAAYVDKILRGTKPADLPVEQATTRLELVINLRTAKALGLNVSPTVLARADEVIE